MNLYELVPMTYSELETMYALVEETRNLRLANGSGSTLELDSMKEKLGAAAKRLKLKEDNGT